MRRSLIGKRLVRKEDGRLLTGRGRFSADVSSVGQLYAAFLRSEHAHADILNIDTSTARLQPGVMAVLTGSDYVSDGNSSLEHVRNLPDHLDPTRLAFADEELAPSPQLLPIATDRVRYVGEIVAMVVARNEAAAHDALEFIEVGYRTLPAVTDARDALEDDAPKLFGVSNVCVRAQRGDVNGVRTALAGATRIVRTSLHNHRVYGCPMEPRAALAEFDPGEERFTLYAPSQGVHRYKRSLAAALAVPADCVRVLTGDVGGGFGLRIPCANEYPLMLWAARRCAQPVKWVSSRSESFLADFHGRDVYCDAALAIGDEGQFTALKISYLGNVGAHPISFAVLSNLLRMAGPPYDIPSIAVSVRGAYTNTVPTSVFRGAGRPEVNHVVERLVDQAADQLGIERDELRRRNLIRGTELPYGTGLGLTYDSGEFAANFQRALDLMDLEGLPERRADAARRGRCLGVGTVNYLESPGAAPYERCDVSVSHQGRVNAIIGTQSTGQGHETSFAQVLADVLEVRADEISISFGDSDAAVDGSGTHADRSMRLGGTILMRAAQRIIEQGRERAEEMLEVASADLRYAEGRFTVVGTDRSVSLYQIAAVAPLEATGEISTRLHAHPTGAAACEVEIDPETGALTLVRYVSVDDVGTVINPMIVEGQIQGGAAQGIGQAMLERVVYDNASGQLLSGSLMDYGLPRADDLPSFATQIDSCPAPSNPLGVKGAGEAGTTAATAAVLSAATDALKALGVENLSMPLTPERVWRAIRLARSVDG